jgi:hypothetical protein
MDEADVTEEGLVEDRVDLRAFIAPALGVATNTGTVGPHARLLTHLGGAMILELRPSPILDTTNQKEVTQ